MTHSNQAIRIGVVMDPIESINPKKDSTLAMLLAAQTRGWTIQYMLQTDLYLQNGQAYASMRTLTVADKPSDWFQYTSDKQDALLSSLDVILMRVDPPYDMEYVYTTQLLEHASRAGSLVVNDPQALRLTNEKLHISWFSELCTPTLVTSQRQRIREFLAEQQDIIIKPLDGMGGQSIFRLQHNDPNIGVILETMTQHDQTTIMAQRFIPDIKQGDKRILMINGEPIPYALARIPAKGETRGNLAAGGSGVGQELSKRDKAICAIVGPVLREQGIVFAGLDVIGDYLTEINVTSPTCIRELDTLYQLDIAGQLLDHIETQLNQAV